MVMRETGVMREAKADTSQEGIARLENLEEMLAGIHEFVDQQLREGNNFTPMTEFLSEVSLLTDQDEKQEDNQPRITLLTIHAAKGLEFKVTFIVGLEENLFPSQFCQAPKEIEALLSDQRTPAFPQWTNTVLIAFAFLERYRHMLRTTDTSYVVFQSTTD